MTSPLNKILLSIFLVLHFFAIGQVLDKEGIPETISPPRLINDFAEIISETHRQELEDKLVAFNDSTSTQICIVTVNSIGDYSIEDYAARLGRKWGVGQKDKNNGILIVVAKEERKVDIEIGYGLESYITDYDSKHIIDELIIPAFKQSNYYQGLEDATNRIIGQLQGTYTAEAEQPEQLPFWVYIIIIGVIIFIVIIISSGSSGRGSGFGGGGSSWTWGSGGGSSWSGGGGSSGGFGGFGGGSFGGGGSSGSW